MCLLYFSPPRKILQNSRKIQNQLDLEKSIKFWKNELMIHKKAIVHPKLLDDPKEEDYKIAGKYGGAFVDMIGKTGEKKYKIGIKTKIKVLLIIGIPANEGVLVHELSHIKLGHLEKQEKYEGNWYAWFLNRKYEREANKELIKHKALLAKRK